MPKDLNELVVSGYKIKTGSKSYDEGCDTGSCKPVMTGEEVNSACATIFSRLDGDTVNDNDERFCATLGGNAGIGMIADLL